MTGQFQLSPDFERSWVNVKLGTSYLVASTSAESFNCYIFDLAAGRHTCADLGVWDCVDLPWPKVHEMAISPDDQTVAFISGLGSGEKAIEGNQVYCLTISTLLGMWKSLVTSAPHPCLSWYGPVDEVESLTLNNTGDGYVVICSKSGDGSSARAAVVYYSVTNLECVFGLSPTLQEEARLSDRITLLPGTRDSDTRVIITQNGRILTALLRGTTEEDRIIIPRSGCVEDHFQGLVGSYGDAVLTVETREGKFGCKSHLMAYKRQSQLNTSRLDLAELLPPLEKNSKLAATMAEEDLIVIATTIDRFRFAVYKIRLPKSLSAKSEPRPLANFLRWWFSDVKPSIRYPNEYNQRNMGMPEGLDSEWNEDTSDSVGSESLYDSPSVDDEQNVGDQDEMHLK